MNGILLLNKPQNISTNKLIQQVKHKFKIKKIGHAGTLDVMAHGVVVVLINNATKLSDYLLTEDKFYQFTIQLFTATDSYDQEGKITEQVTPFLITKELVNDSIKYFNGLSYKQIPPIYSAIKIKGKKLYDYALQNQKVDIKTRDVTINSLELINYENNQITCRAKCSKGTYIRSLAVDIAKHLNTIGHVIDLKRLASGNFALEECYELPTMNELKILSNYEALNRTKYPLITISDEFLINRINKGLKIYINDQSSDTVFVTNTAKEVLACYERIELNSFKCKRGGLNND